MSQVISQIDLHSHTTASDGRLSPTELVRRAADAGVRWLAVTDHDSTEGLAEAQEAARAYPDLTLIPGVEINTDIVEGEIHVVGLFVSSADEGFQAELRRLRDGREGRARKMVEKLNALGYPIQWERVRELAGGAVGRPHVAQALVEAGHVASVQEAFDRLLGRDGPGYVPRVRFSPVEATALIRGNGGLPVLAHPDGLPLDTILPELIQAGLVGVEVYYGSYGPTTVQRLAGVAQRYGLVASGGTDFHGIDPDAPGPGTTPVPLSTIRQFLARKAATVS